MNNTKTEDITFKCAEFYFLQLSIWQKTYWQLTVILFQQFPKTNSRTKNRRNTISHKSKKMFVTYLHIFIVRT